jgi:DNA-binding beta-propeller fold protein YncE
MEGCEGPSGLAIDNKTHTLFSSCDGKLMVVDSNSGKVRQSVAIGDDCDGVTFDPGTGYVFASPSTGKFQIIHADKSGKYSVVQEIDTPVGSKTHGLDPVTHKVYLPSAKFTGDPSKRPRPSVVEGSIQVLVIGE